MKTMHVTVTKLWTLLRAHTVVTCCCTFSATCEILLVNGMAEPPPHPATLVTGVMVQPSINVMPHLIYLERCYEALRLHATQQNSERTIQQTPALQKIARPSKHNASEIVYGLNTKPTLRTKKQ